MNVNYLTNAEYFGHQEGLKEGIQAGMYQEKYAIAKNMIRQGSDEQFISLVTGLPGEKVKELKEALQTQK